MRKMLCVVALVFCAFLTGIPASAGNPQSHRQTLDRPKEIQGYPCAKGYAWFFADGTLEHCTVARDVAFGEANIPAGSWITLNPDGKPGLRK